MEVAARQGDSHVQRGRNLVMWALSPTGEGSSGVSPLVAFSGKGSNQGESTEFNRSSRQHDDGKVGCPRLDLGGLSATRVYAKEDRAPKFSRTPLLEGGFSITTAQVLRAIEDLPPIHRAWVHHRYRSHGQTKQDATRRFASLFWDEYEPELKNTRQSTRVMASYLAQLHVARSSYPLLVDISRPPEIDKMIQGGQIKPNTWKRVYYPHWVAIWDRMEKIDTDAMLAINRAV